MKSALAFLALAGSAAALPAAYVEANEGALWASFKEEHRREYTAAEEPMRRAAFKRNMLRAAELEAQSKTGAEFGATQFSDRTDEELAVYHNLRLPADVHNASATAPRVVAEGEVLKYLGTSIDWRDHNAVTAVKNQGQCGSCYAFGTTGAIEGQQAVAKGRLVSLSEQEIVSCCDLTFGCSGGWPEVTIEYLVNNRRGNIVTEQAYPYTSAGGGHAPMCTVNASMQVGATVSGSKILPRDEDQIAAYLIKNGPLSIGVSPGGWFQYRGGVMDKCHTGILTHAVLAVGVCPEYWIVKNSWGSSWGESGYIRLARGSNQCGMKNHVVAPIIA
eukprot:TRINITY_DN1347_c0_g1_i4.p2 TRINITY_DN1347_c0_g1~~TRINITY_DN1347_c0_g1_i4.p2  ORF type:complete len:331 (+),score=116.36 TRINITY_DN1347_c0_g1_i4:49-1041(+)